MELGLKIWLEHDGKVVMGDFRAELLRVIERTGSLQQAATETGLSYRRAWGKIREIEQNLGVTLIESSPGGRNGGTSQLSPEGKQFVQRYEHFREKAARDLRRVFDNTYGKE